MTTFGGIWFVVVSTFLGYCGFLLIFTTSSIVARAKKKYGYNFFLRPWYSILMRCIGLFIWLLMGLAAY
jgi:hypothetical protein